MNISINLFSFIRNIFFLFVFIIVVSNAFFSGQFNSEIFFGVSVSQLLLGLFLLILFFFNLKRLKRKAVNLISPILLLGLFSVLAIAWSPYPLIAMVFAMKLFFLANIFLSSVILTEKGYFSIKFLHFLAWLVILVTILGQFFGLMLGVKMYDSEFSSAGLNDNGAIISAQILFSVPILLIKGKSKVNYLAIFIAFFSVLLTLRRSALLGFILIFFILFLIHLFKQNSNLAKKISWIGIFFSLLVFIAFVISSLPIGEAVYARFLDLDPTKGSASGRYSFQYLGLVYAFNRSLFNIFFGDGVGHSILVNVQNGFIPIGMHSDFLDIFIGFGLLGVFLFLLFFWFIYKMVYNLSVQNDFFNCSLAFFIALISISFFTGGFFEINTMLGYMAIGFVFGNLKL